MPFPDAPRVLYEINPLDEVVCQLRFPPILRIDAEAPVAYQEQVRGEFPYFQQKSTVATVKLPAGLPEGLSQVIRRDIASGGKKSSVFGSADRLWNLTLARDGLSLACRRYRRWEEFEQRLHKPFEGMLQVYGPAFFNHVCLRYRNVIRRSRLPSGAIPWSELLQPWIIGLVGQVNDSGEVESSQTRCVIKLPDGIGRVDANYGLAIEEPSKEVVFMIDSHLYNDQQTGPSDVFQRLAALHRYAGLFFRWCITDHLHGALRPTVVPMASGG